MRGKILIISGALAFFALFFMGIRPTSVNSSTVPEIPTATPALAVTVPQSWFENQVGPDHKVDSMVVASGYLKADENGYPTETFVLYKGMSVSANPAWIFVFVDSGVVKTYFKMGNAQEDLYWAIPAGEGLSFKFKGKGLVIFRDHEFIAETVITQDDYRDQLYDILGSPESVLPLITVMPKVYNSWGHNELSSPVYCTKPNSTSCEPQFTYPVETTGKAQIGNFLPVKLVTSVYKQEEPVDTIYIPVASAFSDLEF